ncbi:MAG TPA: ABC-2 family transporter protein [Terriglobia bacterium]|nr:ABC-2 family transporter protein [Terriglobia bacterium]
MIRSLGSYLKLAATYVRFNFRAQLEYRGAFFSQVASMFINDGAWVAFWLLFFKRFPVLHGWSLTDVIALWAILTAGFGLAYGIMGNAIQLAGCIAQGEIDAWLLQPRAVLPHLLLGRSAPSAWGDALFGYIVYLGFVRPDWPRMVAFILLSLAVGVAFIGFGVLAGSLSFFLGNAGALADQWRNTLISFSTYPPTLFQGAVKILLYTVIPAGFVSYLPVEALRSMSPIYALLSIGGALSLLGAGTGAFYLGLRRYESGNLVSMKG